MGFKLIFNSLKAFFFRKFFYFLKVSTVIYICMNFIDFYKFEHSILGITLTIL